MIVSGFLTDQRQGFRIETVWTFLPLAAGIGHIIGRVADQRLAIYQTVKAAIVLQTLENIYIQLHLVGHQVVIKVHAQLELFVIRLLEHALGHLVVGVCHVTGTRRTATQRNIVIVE